MTKAKGAIMTKTMFQESFSKAFFKALEETFETNHGLYLDRGTSLLPTLGQISAGEASTPVGTHCATIAAHVEHVILYLEVVERAFDRLDVGQPNWGEIWSRAGGVTEAEWDALRAKLKATYDRLGQKLHSVENWEHDSAIEDALAIAVHTAYHLGEIRQALCTVGRSER
jgi:hypothetical protein